DGVGGGKFQTADDLANAIDHTWAGLLGRKFVVLTGGEPLLQVDPELLAAIKNRGFEIAIETNGTIAAPPGIDWICVSPKAGSELRQTSGHELKPVYPQAAAEPEKFENLRFQHFFLQPMDGPELVHNTQLTIAFCLKHPRWRVSLQTHKIMEIP